MTATPKGNEKERQSVFVPSSPDGILVGREERIVAASNFSNGQTRPARLTVKSLPRFTVSVTKTYIPKYRLAKQD